MIGPSPSASPSADRRGAEDDRWDVMAEEGISTPWLRALSERLGDDFSVEAGGFEQFHTISDPYERAVVSDSIERAASAVTDNLLEARLAHHDFAELIGPDGIRLPSPETGLADIRRGARMDMCIATFGRALVSAFDCLAATAIGVLRIPTPIKQAQLSQFNGLAAMKASSPKMRRAWDDWLKHLDHHKQTDPPGWWEWQEGMRHLHVHRARQNRVLVQRTKADEQPQLIVPSHDPAAVTRQMARFDLHLRRRPRLTDMEDFVMAPQAHDLWLGETATTTLAGVFIAANEFIEDSAHFLLNWWGYTERWSTSKFPPPANAWRPAATLGPSFGGAAPPTRPMVPATGLGHPTLTKRLTVAEKLRVGGKLPGAAPPAKP